MTEITPLPYQGSIPFSTATPFTIREGITMLELVHAIKDWAIKVIPDLNGVLEEFWTKYTEDHAALLANLEVTKDNWQQFFDQFMADVIAQLEGLNDQAMANLISQLASQTRQSLIQNYSYGSRVDDYATVQDAVANALLEKTSVHLDGSEPLTGNVPNFWEVEFTGGGTLTRDGVVFTPNPKSTVGITVNHIYVHAQNGHDANDGLTPTLALKSLAKLQTVLRGLTSQQAAGARWEVHLSGTFPDGQRMFNLPDFPLELRFLGDAPVSGYPVTRINNGSGASPIGLWFEKCPSTVVVEDLWLDGFSSSTGYGILGKGSGDLRIRRCRFSNCQYGYSAIKGMDFYFRDNTCEASVYTGSNAQYNSFGTWDNDTFQGTRGINVTRGTVCHIDYCNFFDNDRAVFVEMHSRANVMLSHFKRNKIGVVTEGGGEWINVNSNFYVGTVDANEVDSENNGVGRETRLYSQTSKNEFHFGSAWRANPDYLNPQVISGTGNQLVYAGTDIGKLPANWFKDMGKKLRVVVWGRTTGATTYAANVALHVLNSDGTGNANLATGTVRAGADGPFRIEFDVWAISANKQKYLVNSVSHLVEPSVFQGDRSVSFADANEKLFRLYCEPAGINDTFQFLGMDTYLMG